MAICNKSCFFRLRFSFLDGSLFKYTYIESGNMSVWEWIPPILSPSSPLSQIPLPKLDLEQMREIFWWLITKYQKGSDVADKKTNNNFTVLSVEERTCSFLCKQVKCGWGWYEITGVCWKSRVIHLLSQRDRKAKHSNFDADNRLERRQSVAGRFCA